MTAFLMSCAVTFAWHHGWCQFCAGYLWEWHHPWCHSPDMGMGQT